MEELEKSLEMIKSIFSDIVKEAEMKVDAGFCPYGNKENICTKPEIKCKDIFYKSRIPYCKYNIKKQELSLKSKNI
ncbi:MAG: hypothetical protein QW041_00380 [Candidatus Pacearchaeota archaeon]